MPTENDKINFQPPRSAPVAVETHSRIAEALNNISACIRSVHLYGRSHPLVDEMISSAHRMLAELLIVQPTALIAVTESCFALDSFPIEDSSGSLKALAKALSERRVSEMTLSTGVTQAECVEFAEALNISPQDLEQQGGLRVELGRRNVLNIQVREGALITESREGQDPADIYEEALLIVEEAMKAVQAGLHIPVPEIRAVVAGSLHSLIGDVDALLSLTGVKSYDRYLAEHSLNACILSMALARDLGMDAASTMELGVSAVLHDVGKVFVPMDIVQKPGRLTENEWEQMRRHAVEGARALAGVRDLPALASTIACEHHMRCDGSGYPSISPNHKPHLLSRLVAIVDSYDALTTDRPYRERWTPQQAIAWMLYEGSRQYDRLLMTRFGAKAGLYPPGAFVTLNNGDCAVVVGGTYKYPDRPILTLLNRSVSANPVDGTLDLSEDRNSALRIVSIANPVEALLPYSNKLLAGDQVSRRAAA